MPLFDVKKKIDELGEGVRIAEHERNKTQLTGFIAELFRGRAIFSYVHPWPERSLEEIEKENRMIARMRDVLLDDLDLETVEQTCNFSDDALARLSREGFFRLKVPEEDGGIGLGQESYVNLIAFINSFCNPLNIMISADNTIGCKFPVLNYGTEAQKKIFLPDLIKHSSGFCFTEPEVGSDPARMKTYARRLKDKDGNVHGYAITGKKQFTTNLPLARNLSVVAKIVDDPLEVENSSCFGIFIVPSCAPGVRIGERNTFSGMRGIYNCNPEFSRVIVSTFRRIGKEGQGFKIALEALNTGRIAIAGGCLGSAKQMIRATLWRAKTRHQWGGSLFEKELLRSPMIARDVANCFAMEAMTKYAAARFDRGRDVRLEAAAAKVFASEKMWIAADNMMQIFGGVGYETYASASRREKIFPVERYWRDARPNRVFEGSTQILSQWFIREGMDFYISLLSRGSWEMVKTLGVMAVDMVFDESHRFLPEPLKEHAGFVERSAKKFVWVSIKKTLRYGDGLVGVKHQAISSRFFWIILYLYAISVTCSYAANFPKDKREQAIFLAQAFCREAELEVEKLFGELAENTDDSLRALADRIGAGEYDKFLEDGILPFDLE